MPTHPTLKTANGFDLHQPNHLSLARTPVMRIKNLLATITLCAIALAHGAASAHETVYTAALLGSSEFPSATTPGSGTATVTMDFDLFTMRVQATFSGLLGTVTASHIHCCTAATGGSNVGVATMTPSFTGFPTGVTAGSYDQTFNMALASSYNAAFITANGGTVGSAFNALVAGLDAGKAYLNIHTSSFAGGEVRALLLPVTPSVPEPDTDMLALIGLGMAGLALRRGQLQA
jgi:hypothetical protein